MTDADRLVVDASVAVKWYVPEVGSDLAAELLESDRELLAPDLILSEVANTLRKKVRRGELTQDEATEIVDGFTGTPPVRLHSSAPLVPGALAIALELESTMYDALYLAVASLEGAVLITADESLAGAVRGTALVGSVRLLAPVQEV